jgi:hypothetical protein
VFEFATASHEEYVSRRKVIDIAKPAHNWMKEWRKTNQQDSRQSPEMPKKAKSKQLKSPQTAPPGVLTDLPEQAVTNKGVTEGVFQFLEVRIHPKQQPRRLLTSGPDCRSHGSNESPRGLLHVSAQQPGAVCGSRAVCHDADYAKPWRRCTTNTARV